MPCPHPRATYGGPRPWSPLRGFHRHRACASLSIASTTDPEEPVGTRYATRGYLIVATSISSNNLSTLRRRRDGVRVVPGRLGPIVSRLIRTRLETAKQASSEKR